MVTARLPKLLLGSVLLLADLLLSPASAQTGDPNALPPPPTYGQPAQPGQPYAQPAYPQPAYPQPAHPQPGDGRIGIQPYTPPATVQPYTPPPAYQPVQSYQPRLVRFRPQFGIGGRVVGLYSASSLLSYGQGGGNFDLMMRVHPRLTLEMSFGYHHIDRYDAYYTNYLRTDRPIILGMRIFPGRPHWVFQPYFVVGAGIDYASADVPDLGEDAVLGEFQGGGGFEIRIGRHFTLNLDMRAFGRFRGSHPDQAYVIDEYGQTARLLGNSGGLMFTGGLGVFF